MAFRTIPQGRQTTRRYSLVGEGGYMGRRYRFRGCGHRDRNRGRNRDYRTKRVTSRPIHARPPLPAALVGRWPGAGYEDTCATREVACDSHTPHRAPVAHPMFVLRSAGWRALPDQGWPGNSINRGDARCPHNTDTGTQTIPPIGEAAERRSGLQWTDEKASTSQSSSFGLPNGVPPFPI